jgi:hypothetical protein
LPIGNVKRNSFTAVPQTEPGAIRPGRKIGRRSDDHQFWPTLTRELGIQQRIELREHAGDRLAPLLVMRIAIQEIDLFESESAAWPRLFVYAHQQLGLAELSEQRFDGLRS